MVSLDAYNSARNGRNKQRTFRCNRTKISCISDDLNPIRGTNLRNKLSIRSNIPNNLSHSLKLAKVLTFVQVQRRFSSRIPNGQKVPSKSYFIPFRKNWEALERKKFGEIKPYIQTRATINLFKLRILNGLRSRRKKIENTES